MKLCMSMIGLGALACFQMVSLVSGDTVDCSSGCQEVEADYYSLSGDRNCYYYDGKVHCRKVDYDKVESPVANAYSCMIKSPDGFKIGVKSCTCTEHCKDIPSGSSSDRQMKTPGNVSDDCDEGIVGNEEIDAKDCMFTTI